MNLEETKEIEYSKVLDLIYVAVDFDYFDDYKYLDIGSMKDPTESCGTLMYFYGYSTMTYRVWFYNDIYIKCNKLSLRRQFIDKWKEHKCEKKELQLNAIDRLIEIYFKELKIINIPNV